MVKVAHVPMLVPSKPGFNSHRYLYGLLVVAGRESGQNCFHAPLNVLPWYLSRYVLALE